MKTVSKLLLLCALAMTSIGFAQGNLISAADFVKLAKSNKNLVIIDASKKSSYAKLHVKKAINIPHKSLYNETEIEGLLLSPEELASVFGSKGVSNTAEIVVYDGGSQKYSSRVYWILKYLGANNVKILHKDADMWRKVRLPVTKTPTKLKATTFTPNINNAVYASVSNAKTADVKLIDARDDNEFDGTADNSEGHLPGAIHINYKDVLKADNSFKSKEEIEQIFKAKGLSKSTPMVGYCRTSVRATVLYVAVSDILGWNNFKVYDGAYLQWVAQGNKIENKSGISVVKKKNSGSGGC